LILNRILLPSFTIRLFALHRVHLGGSHVWSGETLLPLVKNRRRAHADASVMRVAANCGLHRGGPEWKALVDSRRKCGIDRAQGGS
jgi:hypothetical protein